MANRFKVVVDGTGIREYYELEHCTSEETAKQVWLKDVSQRWGYGVASGFEGSVEVTRLTENWPELPAPEGYEPEQQDEKPDKDDGEIRL